MHRIDKIRAKLDKLDAELYRIGAELSAANIMFEDVRDDSGAQGTQNLLQNEISELRKQVRALRKRKVELLNDLLKYENQAVPQAAAEESTKNAKTKSIRFTEPDPKHAVEIPKKKGTYLNLQKLADARNLTVENTDTNNVDHGIISKDNPPMETKPIDPFEMDP